MADNEVRDVIPLHGANAAQDDPKATQPKAKPSGKPAPKPASMVATAGATKTLPAMPAASAGSASLARWPAPPGYKGLDDEAFRRSAEGLHQRPAGTGLMFGLSAGMLFTVLAGLCWFSMGIAAAGIVSALLMVIMTVLSATAIPKLFTFLREQESVQYYKGIEQHLTGYYFGLALGSFLSMLPLALMFLLFFRR